MAACHVPYEQDLPLVSCISCLCHITSGQISPLTSSMDYPLLKETPPYLLWLAVFSKWFISFPCLSSPLPGKQKRLYTVFFKSIVSPGTSYLCVDWNSWHNFRRLSAISLGPQSICPPVITLRRTDKLRDQELESRLRCLTSQDPTSWSKYFTWVDKCTWYLTLVFLWHVSLPVCIWLPMFIVYCPEMGGQCSLWAASGPSVLLDVYSGLANPHEKFWELQEDSQLALDACSFLLKWPEGLIVHPRPLAARRIP